MNYETVDLYEEKHFIQNRCFATKTTLNNWRTQSSKKELRFKKHFYVEIFYKDFTSQIILSYCRKMKKKIKPQE
jgi:hypothetical protein